MFSWQEKKGRIQDPALKNEMGYYFSNYQPSAFFTPAA